MFCDRFSSLFTRWTWRSKWDKILCKNKGCLKWTSTAKNSYSWPKPHFLFHFRSINSTSGYNVSDMYFFFFFFEMKASHFSRCLKIRHACTDFLARFRTFHAQTPKQYTENPAINELLFPQSNNVSISNLSDLSYTERQNWICWCRFKCCCSEPFSLIAYTSLQHNLQGQGWHSETFQGYYFQPTRASRMSIKMLFST